MKTNLSYVFAGGFALVVVAACSGSQSDTVVGADGDIVLDAGLPGQGDADKFPDVTVAPTPDTGVVQTPDTGSGTLPDTGSGTLPDTGSGTLPDTGVVGHDGGGGGGGVCPSSCTTNAECQASCPAVSGALNCCDSVTMACFQSASSACPGGGGGGSDGGGGGGHDGGGGY